MESIETLNSRLVDHFSIDIVTGDPIFRIVFSEDVYEKRLTKYTKEGFELLTPQIVELPKYKQWIHNKYVLERLVVIPDHSPKALELGVGVTSYEPLFVYEDNAGNPLPPKWEVTKYVIEETYAKIKGGKSGMAKYIDSEIDPEAKEERLKNLQEELFGNETDTTDALAYGQAIVVPTNYNKEN